MLPSSLLLILTIFASLSLASSSSAQTCSPSINALDTISFSTSYTNFCSKKTILNTTETTMDLTYTAKDSGCGKDDCLKSFETLLNMCQFNNHTITGSGATDKGCGIFGFVIKATEVESTTVTPSASQTGKPAVGSTALGTSGGGLVTISGGLMAGVAGVFFCFL